MFLQNAALNDNLVDQFSWTFKLKFKRYTQKCSISCTNSHHDIIDLKVDRIFKNIK